MDLVVRLPRLPKPGETVHGHTLIQTPGGKGANQAVAAARLGAATKMVVRVGDGPFGQTLRAAHAKDHIDTTYLQVTRECPSGLAVISVEASGQNSIAVIAGANAHFMPEDLLALEELFAGTDAVLLQLEIPLETVTTAIRWARKHGAMVILDPAPAPSSGLPNELYAVDVISPNRSEAQQLAGFPVDNATDAARAAVLLHCRGARQVVIKLAEQGAIICDQLGRTVHVPAFRVDAIDATAAGDAFQAALAVALIEGRSLVDATRFACAAGALAATKTGAQDALPMRRDVEQL